MVKLVRLDLGGNLLQVANQCSRIKINIIIFTHVFPSKEGYRKNTGFHVTFSTSNFLESLHKGIIAKPPGSNLL